MNPKDREEAVKWLRLGHETHGTEGAAALAKAMGLRMGAANTPSGQYAGTATAGEHGIWTATPGSVTLVTENEVETSPNYQFRSGSLPKRQRAPLACPKVPPRSDPDWRGYVGDSDAFHCGFEGYLENRDPSPDWPIGECFYDKRGRLVDSNHPYAKCAGTPDSYGAYDPRHLLWDPGGILRAGWGAFWESQRYFQDEARLLEEHFKHPQWRLQHGREHAE